MDVFYINRLFFYVNLVFYFFPPIKYCYIWINEYIKYFKVAFKLRRECVALVFNLSFAFYAVITQTRLFLIDVIFNFFSSPI